MLLDDCLRRALRLYPDRTAVVCEGLHLSYAQLGHRVDRLCGLLAGLGLRAGDRVAVLHRNCHRYLEAYLASARLGLVLVPLNFRLSPAELATILDEVRPGLLLFEERFFDRLERMGTSRATCQLIRSGAASRRDGETSPVGDYEGLLAGSRAAGLPEHRGPEEQIAQIYYTSGTTGRFKGVILTHRNVGSHALSTIAELGLSDADVWLHAAPMFHLADAWAVWAVTWVGGVHVMLPSFDPLAALRILVEQEVTLTNLIPTMLNLMVKRPEAKTCSFPHLRLMLSGGAPIAPDVVRRIVDVFGCDYVQTYGLTETSPYLTMSFLKEHLKGLPEEERFRYTASTGREVLGIELRVVDEEGEDVKPGSSQVGEIIVSGDSVTPGYWKLPEETARAIRDGWLYTGDLATIDEERYVTIVDRKKDVIITGGECVYSTEVENALYSHPGVLEAAVIGIPDEVWGESILAVVVLRRGSEVAPMQLVYHCRALIAHYKAPRKVEIVESLPRTGSGKIYKKGLRERYGRGPEQTSPATAAPAPGTQTEPA